MGKSKRKKKRKRKSSSESESSSSTSDRRPRKKRRKRSRKRSRSRSRRRQRSYSREYFSDPEPVVRKRRLEIEPSLESEPLDVVPQISKKYGGSSRWQKVVWDLDARCFLSYLSNRSRKTFTKKQCRRWYETAYNKTKWRGFGSYRTAWYTAGRCNCHYHYSAHPTPPNRFPQWLIDIQRAVFKHCGLEYRLANSCNLNLYEHATSSIPYHQDNEPMFYKTASGADDDCLIVSFSLGQERLFTINSTAHLGGEPWLNRELALMLGDGDICTMGGKFQRYYQHAVPPMPGARRTRVNFTWRWIIQHEKKYCDIKELFRTSPPPIDLVKKTRNPYCRFSRSPS